MANIDTLKTLLQISDNSQDALLSALIDQCRAEYIHRTHQTDADDSIVFEMVAERYNRLGNEGIQQMNYSGISETYFPDYSDKVVRLLRSKTRMVVL